MSTTLEVDVAIIGGGPAGSTVGSLLKKYKPDLGVLILEREKFPRDHIGESQLPFISRILEEMGVWDQVEAAGFPIKVGATYRWGRKDQLWDIEFIRNGHFEPALRPAPFAGQRLQTAFQVDRGRYDEILLNHSESLGCDVRQQTDVTKVLHEGDQVSGLQVRGASGESLVRAKHYVDCSGYVGVMRKALGVEVEEPSALKNIAIWDYWRDAEWAVTLGIEGTRAHILSLGYGWIWFIPIGNGRTSVGLVVPASYYKQQGVRPAELYKQALASDQMICHLLRDATAEGTIRTTKDWSFLASRVVGPNWFICGEAAGFADPILSAGMTLAHKGARDVAYILLELERGQLDGSWLREQYNTTVRRQIGQHIRFADFWYSQNGQFSDLKDHAREISQDAGLHLTSDEAFRWLGTGGFIDNTASTNMGGFKLTITKSIASLFLDESVNYNIFGKTHFLLDLTGATQSWVANFHEGRIRRSPSYFRDGKYLPMIGFTEFLARGLTQERTTEQIFQAMENLRTDYLASRPEDAPYFPMLVIEALEAMILDGWVKCRTVEGFTGWPRFTLDTDQFVHDNRDASRVPSSDTP